MSKKPKILLITNRLVVGGPSRHIAMLARELEKDYEVLLVGGGHAAGEVPALDWFSDLQHRPVLLPRLNRAVNPVPDYASYRQLRKIIRDFKPDIVHTHTSKVGVMGRMAARKENVAKIVHTYHGLLFAHYFSPSFSAVLQALERKLAKKTTHIIALSKSQKMDLVKTYRIAPQEKISVIPLALEPSFFVQADEWRTTFRKQYKVSQDEVAIGIVGRLVPIKNISFFIDALRALNRNKKLKFKAYVVGDGPDYKELVDYAKNDLRVAENEPEDEAYDICFCSWSKQLNFVYSGLDIVTLTSLAEGTPMSLMEAQAAGKAILAADVGGVADVVQDAGIMYQAGNMEEYIRKLAALVSDASMRVELGNRARTFAREQYSIERMMDQIKDLYQKD
jgi:glycosyltransferase involved in cell wall biosynthesis